MPAKLRKRALGLLEAVDQIQRARAFGADVAADRRPVPIDLLRAACAQIQRAVAVAQAGEKCAAAFVAEHVGRGPARLGEGVLDDAGEACRDGAEEAAARLADFVDRVAALVGDEGIRRQRIGCALRVFPGGMPGSSDVVVSQFSRCLPGSGFAVAAGGAAGGFAFAAVLAGGAAIPSSLSILPIV